MTAGELFGLAACAVCAAALGAVVKRSSREHALLLAAVTAVLLLLAALEGAGPLLRELEGLSAAFPGECFPVMLKAVGITIAGQLAAQLCKDAGESALAYAGAGGQSGGAGRGLPPAAPALRHHRGDPAPVKGGDPMRGQHRLAWQPAGRGLPPVPPYPRRPRPGGADLQKSSI